METKRLAYCEGGEVSSWLRPVSAESTDVYTASPEGGELLEVGEGGFSCYEAACFFGCSCLSILIDLFVFGS